MVRKQIQKKPGTGEFNQDTQALRNFFRQVPLFRHLDPDHPTFERLVLASKLQFVRRETYIYRQGDPADRVFLVQSGEVGIVQADSDSEHLLALQRRGSVFGEVSFLSSTLHSSSAKALFDSRIAIIPGVDFVSLIEAEPSVGRELIRLLSERFRGHMGPPKEIRPGRICCVVYAQAPERSGPLCFSLAQAVEQEGGSAVILTLNPRSPLIRERGRNLIEVLQTDFKTILGDGRPEVILNLESLLEAGSGPGESSTLRLTLNDLLSGLRRTFSAILIDLSSEPSLAAAVLLEDADLMVSVTGDALSAEQQRRNREQHQSPSASLQGRLDELVLREIDVGKRPGNPYELPVRREDRRDPEVNRYLRRLARRILGRTRALCLGGGGARALAHAGCLQVFEEAGLEFDAISGVSMGAIVAAVHAMGQDSEEIRQMIRRYLSQPESIFDKTIPFVSFFSGRRMAALLHDVFGGKRIEDMEIPFQCSATDLRSGEVVTFDQGPVEHALLCSASLPGIFPPVQWEGRLLVDGGVGNNLSGNPLREKGYDQIVGINVSPTIDPLATRTGLDRRAGLRGLYRFVSIPPILGIIFRSIAVVNRELMRFRMNEFDFLLHPDVGGFELFAFGDQERIVEEGRTEAENKLEALKYALAIQPPAHPSSDTTPTAPME